jgi:nicotinamidase-related amidase
MGAQQERANEMETKRSAAFLIVDVINHFQFDGGEVLARNAERILSPLLRLSRRARAARVPVIYCNDNFGQWRSDFRATFEASADSTTRGGRFVTQLQPSPTDYFILKPMHSAFFSTPLQLLLDDLGARRVVLAGLATDGCILATAIDAHMRGYEVAIVREGTAAQSEVRKRRALDVLRTTTPIRIIGARAALRWMGA